MAAYDLQEQEQIDALKAWWADNGKLVITLVVVALLALGGYKGWQYWQNQQAEAADTRFEAVQQALQSGKVKQARAELAQLQKESAQSAFTSRAALLTARAAFEAGDTKTALADLKWVAEHAEEAPVKDMAQLRMATVYLDTKQYDLGLSALASIKGEGLQASALSLKGDLLVAMNKRKEARLAYQQALERAKSDEQLKARLEMQIDALGDVK
ncbi:YfgM family protein [Leeia sp.]|uniref:YfgM family protein n=1 Tax=Leeia sp. TaxID=2884678 RepID=UPI0035AE38AA